MLQTLQSSIPSNDTSAFEIHRRLARDFRRSQPQERLKKTQDDTIGTEFLMIVPEEIIMICP